MKLLRVKASGFKNCEDDTIIDFVAKSKKTAEDKEYELQEIASDLYTYNTMAFIGKNASGKTSAIELLDCCYSILSNFRLHSIHYNYDNIKLEIMFFESGYIYKYQKVLKADNALSNRALFTEQHIYKKKYYKSKAKSIFEDGFEEVVGLGELPEDTSILFFVLKKTQTRALFFDSYGQGSNTYQLLFRAIKTYHIEMPVFLNILKIFDENILSLEKLDDNNYKLRYLDRDIIVADRDLLYFLSSGTTKGILLYTMVVASLQQGFDLLIDEVENHFHKTLVENLIVLYKDKTVNKKNASLIFTTHYCELLDLFNRQDNIWVCHADEKIHIDNMYERYKIRYEISKSRQFYNNAFQTSVNYNELMNLKRMLTK